MCNGCFNADEFPALPVSIAALTSANLMYATTNARRIPPFPSSTAGITNINGLVQGMPNLQELPVINMAGASSAGNGSLTGGQSAPSLKRMRISGMRFSFSVANFQLSAAALNEIFTGLPTVVGQTITVTGNYGTSQGGYNPLIATMKGWTVTT
jgi:hypothetical protein